MTWSGRASIALRDRKLPAGGLVRVRFAVVEPPDIGVEQTPAAVIVGYHPQPEKAIAIVLEEPRRSRRSDRSVRPPEIGTRLLPLRLEPGHGHSGPIIET